MPQQEPPQPSGQPPMTAGLEAPVPAASPLPALAPPPEAAASAPPTSLSDIFAALHRAPNAQLGDKTPP
jgi:hypothetical protein